MSKESMTDSYEIQNSVIELLKINRDEELCRKWGALADEDHTHHLTPQEYSLYKSNWWLHSSKQGSNTMPLRHRPDFKQALSTLQRLQHEAGEEPQVPSYSYKPQQWKARFMVDSLSFRKSRRRCTKYWVNGATCCLQYWAKKNSSEKDFHEFNLFCYSLIVYSWRRSTVTDGGCKHNTSNDPFSRCKSVQ